MTDAIYFGYSFLLFLFLLGFALYDISHRRVSNTALITFLPVSLSAPLIISAVTDAGIVYAYIYAVFGASLAFAVMLGAALLSKDGRGIGGGDIKLSAALGFILGPFAIMAVLLLASLLAALFGLACKKGGDRDKMSLPFVPFLAFGCLLLTAAEIICM